MKRRCLKSALAGLLVLTLVGTTIEPSYSAAAAEESTAAESAVQTEINAETVWSYTDEGIDPAAGLANRTDWTLDSYDVSAWKQGTGSFGVKNGAISDLGSGYIPNTLLNQYKEDTTDIEVFFFRTEVEVADVSAVTMIAGNVIYDDSATVYINGVKIAGFDDSDITENIQYGGSNDGTPINGEILVTDPQTVQNVLKNGKNVVAVEVHQGRAASSDLYFDMQLSFSTEALPEPASEPTNVVLNIGSDESQASVTWYTTSENAGTLELTAGGATSTYTADSYATTTSDENGYPYYKNTVTLTGLTAGTAYTYRVSGGVNDGEITWSDTYSFTPKAAGENNSFSFMAVGDPQIGCSNVSSDTEGWVTTMNTALSQNPDLSFLLSLGDQVNNYSAGSQLVSEYNGFLDEAANLTSLPLATILGNHDNGFTTAYTEHYAIPNLSTYGSSNGDVTGDEDYYFTYNGVLFMVLNSNNSSAAEHRAFMESAIAACPDATWKVVAYHHSVYSVASHAVDESILTLRERLAPIFTELDVDVVLQGHDHVYVRSWMMGGESGQTVLDTDTSAAPAEYTDPEGVMYVTLNSASGSKYYNIKSTVYEYSAVQNQEYTQNYSIVKVDDDSFTITTYRTADQSVVDTVTIYKTEVHQLTETAEQAATCTEAGNLAYWTCTDCGKLFLDEAGTVETTLDEVTVPAMGHTWDEGIITKEATTEEEGEKTFTCTECGETYTETVEKLTEESTGESDDSTLDDTDGSITEGDAAETGDITNLSLWILLMVLSACTIAAEVLFTKKKTRR